MKARSYHDDVGEVLAGRLSLNVFLRRYRARFRRLRVPFADPDALFQMLARQWGRR